MMSRHFSDAHSLKIIDVSALTRFSCFELKALRCLKSHFTKPTSGSNHQVLQENSAAQWGEAFNYGYRQLYLKDTGILPALAISASSPCGVIQVVPCSLASFDVFPGLLWFLCPCKMLSEQGHGSFRHILPFPFLQFQAFLSLLPPPSPHFPFSRTST